MLLKLPAIFCPLAERLDTSQGRTLHKRKKLRRFETISFRVTMFQPMKSIMLIVQNILFVFQRAFHKSFTVFWDVPSFHRICFFVQSNSLKKLTHRKRAIIKPKIFFLLCFLFGIFLYRFSNIDFFILLTRSHLVSQHDSNFAISLPLVSVSGSTMHTLPSANPIWIYYHIWREILIPTMSDCTR